MGRFGIAAGALAGAIVLAIPLVSGGGTGAFTPEVAGSGPATPPSATRAVDAAGASIPSVQGQANRTPSVTAESSVGDTATAPVDENSFGATDFATGGGAAPWVGADKETAPNLVTPPYLSTDPDTVARVKDLASRGLSCPELGTFTTSGAPSKKSTQGVPGTTTADLVSFATQYNQLRYENCLPPVTRFIYDSCMELRLFWMAESPSPDPLDAWGHIGSVRIDGVPSVGCDGNLAGGSNNTGATVATKWWNSLSHRASLYRPGTSTAGVCVALAMTHGGIDEPYSFTRAAARWVSC